MKPASENEIFNAARKLASPAARLEYVQTACGPDLEWQARILALLDLHDRNSGFLASAAPELSGFADLAPVADEGPGTQVGPYTLLKQIGEGGMGRVFLARQGSPIARTVALKVTRPGMETETVVARFEAERRALSRMNHPHIARVLDAGTTDSGRPFFVMELVRGLPVTTYCDELRLPVRARLELFVTVCHAIHHAHLMGIVHRDIKPSNVLVTEYDGRPVCKLIDFGVAKSLDGFSGGGAPVTSMGQLLGTPAYMCPEQTRPGTGEIDARSDVYSLGVLLYELLAGTTPLEPERLRTTEWDEMVRMIREDEPPRPSVRLRFSGGNLPALATSRSSEPARLVKQLRGELDWIVMRSLEKEARHRYQTAQAFADDVQRFLDNEPVHACRPTGLYRLRKLASRRRTPIMAVASGLLVCVLALSGWSVSRSMLRQAWSESNAARQTVAESEARARLGESRIEAVLDYLDRQRQASARAPLDAADQETVVGLRQGVQAALARLDLGFHLGWGPGTSTVKVATDRAGNIFATGAFQGRVDFDPGPGAWPLTSNQLGTGFDCWLAKYSPAGVLIWARRIGGPVGESLGAFTVDAGGNSYLGGQINGTVDFDPGRGEPALTAIAPPGICIARIDPDGKLVWTVSASGSSNSQGLTDLAIDSQGNVCAVGMFDGKVDFDPGPGSCERDGSGRYQDAYAWKLTPAGELAWVRVWGSGWIDAANALALDAAGNFYVTGHFSRQAGFHGQSASAFLSSSGKLDAYVLCLSPAGNLVWSRGIGGTGDDFGWDVFVDKDRNVVVAGSFELNADFGPDALSHRLVSQGKADGLVVKLSPLGQCLWTRSMGGPGRDWATAIVGDGSGGVLVAGSFTATADLDPGPHSYPLNAIGDGPDAFLSRFDWDGEFLGAVHFGGNEQPEEGSGIALDAQGNAFVGFVSKGGNVVRVEALASRSGSQPLALPAKSGTIRAGRD